MNIGSRRYGLTQNDGLVASYAASAIGHSTWKRFGWGKVILTSINDNKIIAEPVHF